MIRYTTINNEQKTPSVLWRRLYGLRPQIHWRELFLFHFIHQRPQNKFIRTFTFYNAAYRGERVAGGEGVGIHRAGLIAPMTDYFSNFFSPCSFNYQAFLCERKNVSPSLCNYKLFNGRDNNPAFNIQKLIGNEAKSANTLRKEKNIVFSLKKKEISSYSNYMPIKHLEREERRKGGV